MRIDVSISRKKNLISEYLNLYFNRIPLETIRERSESRYQQLLSVCPLVAEYILYKKAYSLGVRFGVNDLDIHQINYYAIIDEEIEKLRARKQ